VSEAARSCDGKQTWRLGIESSLFEQTFSWSWTHRLTQLIEICSVRLSPSQSDRMSRTGGCALVTTDFFPECVSMFSRKVEASLPGPCSGGPTCRKLAVRHMYICLYICLSVCAAQQWGARDRVAHMGYNGKQMYWASAQIFSAFRPQTFYGSAWTRRSNTSHWDGRDRVSHRGCIRKKIDCATAQTFSAFRRQTF